MYPPWTSISDAVEFLKKGEVVAIPTETVYGLAGNVFNTKALAKIFEAKKRPTFDPLIVHIAEYNQLFEVASEIPESVELLAKHFWPGPLTIILKKKENIPELATSGLSTVAIRFPIHPIAREIIKKTGFPLAAPSANLFKHVSPTTAEHVAEQLGDRIAGIVDGGPCSVGVESTIISLAGEIPTLYRPGGITKEMLERVLGPIQIGNSSSHPGHGMIAPGGLDTHYKPSVPLFYGKVPDGCRLPPCTVRIAFGKNKGPIPETVNLSVTEDLTEATAKLYALMHQLDKPTYNLILVDSIPNIGLGMALNDRLSRASIKDLKLIF